MVGVSGLRVQGSVNEVDTSEAKRVCCMVVVPVLVEGDRVALYLRQRRVLPREC
jgi:hypothetical protein